MRTADACPECMAQIRSRIAAGKLSAEVVDDCFRLMDAVRTKALHRRNGGLKTQPCNLEIHGYNQDLHLRGKRVPLPIRRALYQHFLLHPEGVRLYDLTSPITFNPSPACTRGLPMQGHLVIKRPQSKARGKRGWPAQSALVCHLTHPDRGRGPERLGIVRHSRRAGKGISYSVVKRQH